MILRILVIEDDPVLHHILSKRLKEEGHSVDDCYDGEAGFDYADAMQYDCIVLDLMLPKRDGLSLLRDLRSRGNASPVLILTPGTPSMTGWPAWTPAQTITWSSPTHLTSSPPGCGPRWSGQVSHTPQCSPWRL